MATARRSPRNDTATFPPSCAEHKLKSPSFSRHFSLISPALHALHTPPSAAARSSCPRSGIAREGAPAGGLRERAGREDAPWVMIREIRREGAPPRPVWLDLVEPTAHDFELLAREYRLHPTLVADCLEPMHLPKHEQSGDVTFLIVRAFNEQAQPDDTEVQDLTRKVALFLGNRFLITAHRHDLAFLAPILRKYRSAPEPIYLFSGMLEVLLKAVDTYHPPLEEAEDQIHAFEAAILTDRRDAAHWDAIFRTQTRLTVIKRMLWHTLNAVQRFVPRSERSLPLCQDLRERVESLLFFADNLLEDLRNLLAVQLSLAANDTNDVMRTLAIYSVFFMPLTFIVGVYGMNFEHIPELRWRFGYLAVWLALLITSLAIWRWFRRKHWL
jgi:magnesium transporter